MSNEVSGYTNLETATVGFHLAHNRGPNEYWKQVTRDMLDNGLDVSYLAKALEHVITLDAAGISGLVRELLDASLNAVDWLDVAETIWTSIKEELAYEEV